jgi:cytochrome c peroxidase
MFFQENSNRQLLKGHETNKQVFESFKSQLEQQFNSEIEKYKEALVSFKTSISTFLSRYNKFQNDEFARQREGLIVEATKHCDTLNENNVSNTNTINSLQDELKSLRLEV